MARNKFIADPSEPIEKQERLFEQPGYKPSTLRVHPDIDRSLVGLRHVINSNDPIKGIDLEFDENYRPTIVSVTLRNYISSVKWGPDVVGLLMPAFSRGGTQWVAHSGISADRPVVHKALGVHTSLDNWDDSMITHYLCNQHLTKAPQKDESDDAGAAGFMNLWAAASITTDLYNWKTCRGTVCEGPCPAHDPVGYCGVDSWAGLEIFTENKETMKQYGVPWQFYREQMELAEICYDMELAGVKVDVPYAKAMDAQAELMKEKLFEYSYPAGLEDKLRGEAVTLGLKREEDIIHYILEKGKKKRTYELFNPRAPKQMAEWFEKQGLTLKSAQKDDILTALEAQIREETGCDSLKGWEEASAGSEPDEPSFLLQQLHNVYRFKSEGKGLDPWFADKYLSKDGFIHPRFIPVGASTGRLSSSRPNMMNVPARGFGDLVRKAIIPRDDSLELLKADFGQLELRMVLYLAGVSPNILGADAFLWLVDQSEGQFSRAAETLDPIGYGKDPRKAARNVAKRISHAGDYLEGFQLLDPIDLQKPRILREIEVGARAVYTRKYYPQLKKDWTFQGKVVSFTGVNLGITLFGDKSFESRAKALAIQEGIYFKRFWSIREWHMSVTDEIENRGYLKMPTGTFVRLFGRGEDRAKVAVATLGQGVAAHHVQAIMLKYRRETGTIPLFQVHDELVWEIPRDLSDRAALDFVEIMRGETWRLADFAVPSDAKRGKNWKDLRSLE